MEIGDIVLMEMGDTANYSTSYHSNFQPDFISELEDFIKKENVFTLDKSIYELKNNSRPPNIIKLNCRKCGHIVYKMIDNLKKTQKCCYCNKIKHKKNVLNNRSRIDRVYKFKNRTLIPGASEQNRNLQSSSRQGLLQHKSKIQGLQTKPSKRRHQQTRIQINRCRLKKNH